MPFRRVSAPLPPVRRTGVILGLLLCAAFLFTRAAMPPARAQAHVHDFANAGSPHTAPAGSFIVSHYGGGAITSGDPAAPCEPLALFVGVLSDADKCFATGCPFPLGVLTMMPGGAHVVQWDDNGSGGHFGKFVGGLWQRTDLGGFGTADTTHYRVDRDQPNPSTITIRLQIDDELTWGNPLYGRLGSRSTPRARTMHGRKPVVRAYCRNQTDATGLAAPTAQDRAGKHRQLCRRGPRPTGDHRIAPAGLKSSPGRRQRRTLRPARRSLPCNASVC